LTHLVCLESFFCTTIGTDTSLPRVRLEFDRLNWEINSKKAELDNIARIYQGFCDRNLNLSKREHELQLSISELEVKKIEFQKVITELQDRISMLRESETDDDILDIEIKQMEEVISMNDVIRKSPNTTNNYQQNENEVEPSYLRH
jgi:hypothetical protein